MTTIFVAIISALISAIVTLYFNKKQFSSKLETAQVQMQLKNYTTFKDAWDMGRKFEQDEAEKKALYPTLY